MAVVRLPESEGMTAEAEMKMQPGRVIKMQC
jgi:hypothetical protein